MSMHRLTNSSRSRQCMSWRFLVLCCGPGLGASLSGAAGAGIGDWAGSRGAGGSACIPSAGGAVERSVVTKLVAEADGFMHTHKVLIEGDIFRYNDALASNIKTPVSFGLVIIVEKCSWNSLSTKF